MLSTCSSPRGDCGSRAIVRFRQVQKVISRWRHAWSTRLVAARNFIWHLSLCGGRSMRGFERGHTGVQQGNFCNVALLLLLILPLLFANSNTSPNHHHHISKCGLVIWIFFKIANLETLGIELSKIPELRGFKTNLGKISQTMLHYHTNIIHCSKFQYEMI